MNLVGCQCCVCRGKKCLVWHPGHSCRVTRGMSVAEIIAEQQRSTREIVKAGVDFILDTSVGGK